MRYKEIEKIPYITAIIPEGYKYAAMAAVMNVGGKDTLIVELYDGKAMPRVRICIDDEKYANYVVADKKWNGRLIYGQGYNDIVGFELSEYTMRNSLHPGNTKREYEKFTHNTLPYRNNILWSINELESRIHEANGEKREKSKSARIKELVKTIPPLSDGFREFVHSRMNDNYMFYLRKGSVAFLTCTKCGNREKYYTGIPVTIEDYAKSYIDTPAKGETCTCKFCGARAEYKQEGHYKGSWTVEDEFYNITALEDNKCMIQLVKAAKTYSLGEAEEWKYTIRANAVYAPGAHSSKKLYHKAYSDSYDTANSKTYDDDHVGFDRTDSRHIYNLAALSSTCLRYSGLKEYYGKKGRISPVRYADAYLRYPEIEFLLKKGLIMLAEATISQRKTQIKPGKTVWDRLGIRQNRIEQLVKEKGNTELLELFRLEAKTGQQWPDELVPDIRKLGFREFSYALRYMTITKYVRYITGQGGSRAQYRYDDYLKMKAAAGYDMTDSITLFPKDLDEAHSRITLEINEKKNEERMKEKNEKFPEIAMNYQSLCKKYEYKKDGYIIRPANSAAEIIREGTALHHCVGASDTYMSQHAKGTSYILVLRKLSAPDVPYCTVEIAGNRIRQWYQAYDKKPDAKDIQPWLNKYLSTSKLRALGSR